MSDEHTTSRWNVAHVAGGPARSYATVPRAENNAEAAGWDDPEEATRRLQSVDLASAIDPARPLAMDWDDDELTTHMWSQLHMPTRDASPSAAATSRSTLIAQHAREAAANRSKHTKSRAPATRKDSTVQLRAQNRQPPASVYQDAAPPPSKARIPVTRAYGRPSLPLPARTASRPVSPAAPQPVTKRADTRAYAWQPAPHASPQAAPAAQPHSQHVVKSASALSSVGTPALRPQPQPRQLRILPDDASAMPSLLEDAELERQSTRALWVRSLVPGLALFAAVFVARVLMFEGVAPVQPTAASAAQAAAPIDSTPEPTPVAASAPVGIAPPVAPTPLPASAPTLSKTSRLRSSAADARGDSLATPARSSASEPRAATRRTNGDGVASERVAREPRDEPAPVTNNEPGSNEGARAAPARDVAQPAASGSGMLRINSRPWSKVFVDGTLVGTTPQMAITLSPGQHTITLVNPEFEMSKTVLIDIESNQLLTKVVNLIE